MSERGIDIYYETVRFWWNRFGPMFAAEIRKRRVNHRSYSRWRWHLDEVFVRINGETRYLWRAVDHEGEVLEVLATKRRDRRECGRWLNNRAENSHQPFRRREGAMARFRGIKSLRKFASVHASVHNHLNLDRHLDRRDIFKQIRWVALAEWRQRAA